MKIIEGLPPKGTYDYVALDIEVFGAYSPQLHRPSRGGTFACLSVCPDGKNVYLIQKQSDIDKALQRIDNATWVFHNAVFDWPWLKYLVGGTLPDRPPGLFWDTIIIERDLWGGEFESFSLADLSRRWLGKYLDKRDQTKFVDNQEMTPSMLQYAAKDALTTWQVREVQERFLDDDPQTWLVWNQIDAPAFWAIQAFKGFHLDKKRWLFLSTYFADEAEKIESILGFNPRSSAQTLEALAKRKIYPRMGKKPSTNEKVLATYADDPLVQKILECRGYSKSANTYGAAFVEKYLEEDGCIHAQFEVTKALTGRLSSSSPNMQNIPRDKQFRECFVGSPKS